MKTGSHPGEPRAKSRQALGGQNERILTHSGPRIKSCVPGKKSGRRAGGRFGGRVFGVGGRGWGNMFESVAGDPAMGGAGPLGRQFSCGSSFF